MIVITKTLDIKNSAISFEVNPQEISLVKVFLGKIFRLKLKCCFSNVSRVNIREENK